MSEIEDEVQVSEFSESETSEKEEDDPLEWVESLLCFHGFLTTFDLLYFVENAGDFLIWTSEYDGKVQILITVGVSLDQWRAEQNNRFSEEKIQTLEDYDEPAVMQRTYLIGKDERGYSIEDLYFFNNIQDLYDFYVFGGQKIGGEFCLKNPIPRMLCQFRHVDISRDETLGSGVYGDVFLANLHNPSISNEKGVVKTINSELTNEEEHCAQLQEEVQILRRLNHPNIILLYGWAYDKKPLMFVLEYMEAGSLAEYLEENFMNTSTKRLMNFCVDVAKGLEYIHSEDFLLRDVAIRNCHVHSNGTVKISDFSLAVDSSAYRISKTENLPTRYFAPETLIDYIFTTDSDVYSFGVLMYEVFSGGEMPYPDLTAAEAREMIIEGGTNSLEGRMPLGCRDWIKTFLWAFDPDDRFGMEQIVEFFEEKASETTRLSISTNFKRATTEELGSTLGGSGDTLGSSKSLDSGTSKRRGSGIHRTRRQDVFEEFSPVQETLEE